MVIVWALVSGTLAGFVSPAQQAILPQLIDMKAIKLVGTDCHNMGHINLLKEATTTKYWKKLLDLELLNNQL